MDGEYEGNILSSEAIYQSKLSHISNCRKKKVQPLQPVIPSSFNGKGQNRRVPDSPKTSTEGTVGWFRNPASTTWDVKNS